MSAIIRDPASETASGISAIAANGPSLAKPKTGEQVTCGTHFLAVHPAIRGEHQVTEEFIDIETLPCGCALTRKLIDGEKVLQYASCHQTCMNYLSALGVARDMGKPTTKRVE